MTSLLQLMLACQACPADALPLLILADWLEENGDSTNAESIRHELNVLENTPASIYFWYFASDYNVGEKVLFTMKDGYDEPGEIVGYSLPILPLHYQVMVDGVLYEGASRWRFRKDKERNWCPVLSVPSTHPVPNEFALNRTN